MNKIFILITLLLSGSAFACSCHYDRTMEQVASESSVIFYGEVIGIEKTGKIVPSGEKQEYRITVYPQITYKGKPKKKYSFKGSNYYNDTDELTNPGPDGTMRIRVGGCGLDMTMGSKYVILIERGKKPQWSWCSEHILPKGTRKFDFFMNNIRNKL